MTRKSSSPAFPSTMAFFDKTERLAHTPPQPRCCTSLRAVKLCAAPNTATTENTVFGDEPCGDRSQHHGPPLRCRPWGGAGGAQYQQATGQRNVAQSPVAGATRPHPSPFTNQPKQEGPQTSHASSRSIPEPPKTCSPGRMRQPEADDRREKTCVPSVSVLALFSFPRGNV